MRGYGLAATAFLLVALAFAAGCSSASDTSHPNAASSTLSGAASPTITAEPATATAEPPKPTDTPAPTEHSQFGVAPAFADLSNSITAAIASNGGVLPPVASGIDFFNKNLGWCNEQGLEGVAPQLYATGVIGGCTFVANTLKAIYQGNPTPEVVKALNDLKSFTIGAGGKIEQLAKAGKPAGSTFYLDQTFFTLPPKQ